MTLAAALFIPTGHIYIFISLWQFFIVLLVILLAELILIVLFFVYTDKVRSHTLSPWF